MLIFKNYVFMKILKQLHANEIFIKIHPNQFFHVDDSTMAIYGLPPSF